MFSFGSTKRFWYLAFQTLSFDKRLTFALSIILREFLASGGASQLHSIASARDRFSEEMQFEEARRQHERYQRVEQVLKLRDELGMPSSFAAMGIEEDNFAGLARNGEQAAIRRQGDGLGAQASEGHLPAEGRDDLVDRRDKPAGTGAYRLSRFVKISRGRRQS